MISKLINWCIANRAMVLLLTAVLVAAGIWGMMTIKVDAIPDLSDVQVIVQADYPGQAPQIVEEQVTYKLTTALLNLPGAKAVRGTSTFGTSFVYVIFEDGTDMYWARSRVLERLSYISTQLPTGVVPKLGPEASGVGWVYEYVLLTGKYCPDHPNGAWHDTANDKWYASPDDAPAADAKQLVHHRAWRDGRTTCPLDGKPLKDANIDLARLRGLQDFHLKYELSGLDGVAEIASLGGFQKQYQVVIDPVKLQAFGLALDKVRDAIDQSNVNAGGRVIELAEREYLVQGLGYLGTLSDEEIAAGRAAGKTVDELRTAKVQADLGKIALAKGEAGMPIYLSDVADIRVGPEMRRGLLEWNGEGETAGGIVVMRYGENAQKTIEAVRTRLNELQSTLPPGVFIEVGYDRSDLITRAIDTLKGTLIEEITVVALVCILFLLHARSELVAVFVVPTGVLCSLLIMRLLGINANVMSLGGIAIAIGVMVDSSIVMVENAHKHLDREDERMHALAAQGMAALGRPRTQIIAEAAAEVGPSLFFALLIITVSFLPVFVLGEQSGRMFKPLAFTKTFAMASSAFLAVTVIPVLMSMFITSRVLPKAWGWPTNLMLTLGAMVMPALVILMLPLHDLAPYKPWIALGWFIFAGMLLVPQRIIHENKSPLSWLLQRMYEPAFALAMKFKLLVAGVALAGVLWVLLFLLSLTPGFHEEYPRLAAMVPNLGSEFMPPMEEGDLLYMPTTEPGLSMTKARELLQQTDRMIKQFPEVQSIMGKTGRADTATDPAPVNMLETTIMLSRDKSRWRHVPTDHFYSNWPAALRWLPDKIWATTRPITVDELVHGYTLHGGEHVPGLDETVRIPGLTNSWTYPIRTRIDMLSTGVKSDLGVKILGPDLATLGKLSDQIANVIKTDPRTGPHTLSAFAPAPLGGTYLDVRPNRDELARSVLSMKQVQDVIASAVGGSEVTTTVEGLERYSVNVRYPTELRDSIETLKATLVSTGDGTNAPLGQLATFEIRPGPDMITSDQARPSNIVFVSIGDQDVGTYVENAQKAVASAVTLPPGYSIEWAGQYQYMQAAIRNIIAAALLALSVIIFLLYLATKSLLRTVIVLLAVPFSLIGAILLVWLLGYKLSLAVWIGIIALAGLDAETGIVMLLYLDNSFERFRLAGRMATSADLWHAIHDGAVKRIRPKTMTVSVAFIGLLPLLWSTGAGADTMRRLAAPMIGGLATSFILELLVYPVLFYFAKRRSVKD